jgi:predicted nuclease of predicted toxin-antitoxin system
MLLRFHLDESVNHAVAAGLQRRGIDVTTATDAGLLSAVDEDQFAYAIKEKRVLVTHDDDFLKLHKENQKHAGIAYIKQQRRTIGQIVLALASLYHRCSTEYMQGRVEYL